MGESRILGGPSSSLEQPLLAPSSEDGPLHRPRQSFVSVEDKDIVLRCGFSRTRRRRRRECLRLNHNVFLNFVFVTTFGISHGLWGGAVYAAYLKQLYGGRNAPLGMIEAVNSIAELAFAVPIGYIADRCGRSKVIRAGAVLFLFTAAIHIATTYWIQQDGGTPTTTTTAMLMVIMTLWGIGSGMVDGPCEALFADSIPPGRRTQYYTYLEIFYLLATVLGPLLSLVIFQSYNDSDDQWDMTALVIIIYVGLAMEVVTAIVMMFFDDDKALEHNDSDSEIDATSDRNEGESGEDDALNAEDLLAEVARYQDTSRRTANPTSEESQWCIPYILVASQLVAAASMGLSDAYFPLYLKDDCGMSPVQVQILYGVEPIFIAVMTWVAARTAKSIGRVQTILLFDAAAILFFAAIPIFNVRHNLWLLMVLSIASSAFGDSYNPLGEALMADSLPRGKRARWMSLSHALSGLHQSATAILGGYLSDYWGYRGTFLATCAGEALALALFALLLPLVPSRETPLANLLATPSAPPRHRRISSLMRYQLNPASLLVSSEEEQQALVNNVADDNRDQEDDDD